MLWIFTPRIWRMSGLGTLNMQRLLPHFPSPRKQQNICKRVMRACSCTAFYKSPSVLGVSSLCRQLLPQEVQWMKVESQEPTLQHLGKVRNPQPHSYQQVSGKWDKPGGHLENKDLENKLRRNFLQGALRHFSWHQNWSRRACTPSGSCSSLLCHYLGWSE